MGAPRARGPLAARLAIAFLAVLLPLAGLEVGLRAFGPFLPGSYRTGTDLVAHPVFGHFHRPNAVVWRRTAEFVAEERINSRGLRERELPYEKAPGTRRVLVLGDSFVEAVQVDARQTLTARLEALLNEQGGPTEVINAGVGGFGTAQEWLFFREEGHRYRPDLVLLVFFLGNDVRNNSHRLDNAARLRTAPYFTVGPDGTPEPVDPGSGRQRTREGGAERLEHLLRASVLYNVFETGVLEKLDDGEDPDEGYAWSRNERVFAARYPRDWEEAWEVTEALLAALRGEVTARGARLVLVAAPADLQVRPDDWERLLREQGLRARDFDLEKPNRRLGEVAGRLGLPLIDLLPALRDAERRSSAGLYFRQNRHWTPEGHAVAARAIAEGLLALDEVPAR